MSTPRRSRLGWSDDMTDEPPQPEHVCRLPRWVRLSLVGLVVAVFLLAIGLSISVAYDYQQQQYIEGRGEERDRENAEMNQRITDRICDLLALSPADSPQADYYRAELDCPQPGVATDQLPPEIRQRYENAPPTAPPEPAAIQPTTPPLGSAAVPDPPRRAPNTPTPSPSPTPPPLVDPGPVTDLACDLVGVCL